MGSMRMHPRRKPKNYIRARRHRRSTLEAVEDCPRLAEGREQAPHLWTSEPYLEKQALSSVGHTWGPAYRVI